VKNIYDKIYNNSLELGIQRYLKHEILDKDNKYFCERCGKKVVAKRGCRFVKVPRILSFNLTRFTYDFNLDKRIKLNDFVSFPFILNMNDYLGGYDFIGNKKPENEVDPNYFDNDIDAP